KVIGAELLFKEIGTQDKLYISARPLSLVTVTLAANKKTGEKSKIIFQGQAPKKGFLVCSPNMSGLEFKSHKIILTESTLQSELVDDHDSSPGIIVEKVLHYINAESAIELKLMRLMENLRHIHSSKNIRHYKSLFSPNELKALKVSNKVKEHIDSIKTEDLTDKNIPPGATTPGLYQNPPRHHTWVIP
ncbi:hypothetical protein N9O57_02245, partial [bacterium]|nr:hypothetical protein [bacterium]